MCARQFIVCISPRQRLIYTVRALACVFFCLSANFPLHSQPNDEDKITTLNNYFIKRYGPDQNLINGALYINLHHQATGHKFLGDDAFTTGRVLLDNHGYNDLRLKYDLYNQEVILQYNFLQSGIKEIILNSLRIQEFELEGRVFRRIHFPETGTLFFQVIAEGDIACYYHYLKEIIPRVSDRRSIMEFTQTKRISFVAINSELRKFKGTRSFTLIFPEYRSHLKEYFRENKIRIRKTSDAEMKEVIRYCNNMLRNPSEDK